MRSIKKYAAVAMAVSALGMTAACGSDDSSTASGTNTDKASATTADPARDLVGPGCADYAKAVASGPGSVQGMSLDPVATAASNNPLLTTLVDAVSGKVNPKVNLVDTLNGDEFTVFAPVNDAFSALFKAKPELPGALSKDADLLSTVLTYHVLAGQIAPDKIAGTHETLAKQELKVTGSGDNLKVNGANVICGGVHTANATVYMIDQVLIPKL